MHKFYISRYLHKYYHTLYGIIIVFISKMHGSTKIKLTKLVCLLAISRVISAG